MLKSAHFISRKNGVNHSDDMARFHLNFAQTCKILGVSRGSVYRYIAEGKLKAKREEFGNPEDIDRDVSFKFDPEEVDRFNQQIRRRRKRGQRLI